MSKATAKRSPRKAEKARSSTPQSKAQRKKQHGRSRRLNWGSLPVPPESAETAYGNDCPELKNLTKGEKVQIVMSTFAFCSTIGRELHAIDAAHNNGRSCRPRVWSAWDLERVLLYGRLCKKTTIKGSLKALAGDQRARRLFGFTGIRIKRNTGKRTIHDRLPSESTLSRYIRERWGGIDERRDAYRELDRALVQQLLQEPTIREEARILGMDGTNLDTRYTGPILDADTGEIKNADRVTAPEAGSGGKPGPDNPKGGFGWHVLPIATMQGTVLSWSIEPRSIGEVRVAHQALAQFGEEVRPHLTRKETIVLSADGAFSGPEIRDRIHSQGIVANVHHTSHAEKSEEQAKRVGVKRIPIDIRDRTKPAYKHWFATGHRELVCKCGQGHTEREISIRDGKLAARLIGRCKSCGNVTITAGRWRLSRNPAKYVPCESDETPDLAFGNPLTFNDRLAEEYGKDRLGNGEGLNGTLSTGYRLIAGKRWIRTKAEAELDVAMVVSIINSLALTTHQQRRRQSKAPPGS